MLGGTATASSTSTTTTTTPGKSGTHSLATVRSVKARHSDELFGVPGAVGHGVALAADGSYVIEVYLERDSLESRAKTPRNLENVPVQVVVTGLIDAY